MMPRGLLCFGALSLGLIRKSGFPRLSMKYFQDRIIQDENFWMIGFLVVAIMADKLAFIIYIPILLYGTLVCARISVDTSHTTKIYANLINTFKVPFCLEKVLSKEERLEQIRHDIEIYMGVYLTVGIFINFGILTTIVYW